MDKNVDINVNINAEQHKNNIEINNNQINNNQINVNENINANEQANDRANVQLNQLNAQINAQMNAQVDVLNNNVVVNRQMQNQQAQNNNANLNHAQQVANLQQQFDFIVVEKPHKLRLNEHKLEEMVEKAHKRAHIMRKKAKKHNNTIRVSNEYSELSSNQKSKRTTAAIKKQDYLNAVTKYKYKEDKKAANIHNAKLQGRHADEEPMTEEWFQRRVSRFLEHRSIDDFKFKDDKEFSDNIEKNYAIVKEARLISKQLMDGADGKIPAAISGADKQVLLNKLAVFLNIGEWMDRKCEVMKEQYYVYLAKKDLKNPEAVLAGLRQEQQNDAVVEMENYLEKVVALNKLKFDREKFLKKDANFMREFNQKSAAKAQEMAQALEREKVFAIDKRKVDGWKDKLETAYANKQDNLDITETEKVFNRDEFIKDIEEFEKIKVSDLKCSSIDDIIDNSAANKVLFNKADSMQLNLARFLQKEDHGLSTDRIIEIRAKLNLFNRVRNIENAISKYALNYTDDTLKSKSLNEFLNENNLIPKDNVTVWYEEIKTELRTEQNEAKNKAKTSWSLLNRGKELTLAEQDTKSTDYQKNAALWEQINQAKERLAAEETMSEFVLLSYCHTNNKEYIKPDEAVLGYMRGKSKDKIIDIYNRLNGSPKEKYLLYKEIVTTSSRNINLSKFTLDVNSPDEFVAEMLRKTNYAKIAGNAVICSTAMKDIVANNPDMQLTEKEAVDEEWHKEAQALGKFATDHLVGRMNGIMDLASIKHKSFIPVISLNDLMVLNNTRMSIQAYLDRGDDGTEAYPAMKEIVAKLDAIIKKSYSSKPNGQEMLFNEFNLHSSLSDVYLAYRKGHNVINLETEDQKLIKRLEAINTNPVFTPADKLRELRETALVTLSSRYKTAESEFFSLSNEQLKQLVLETLQNQYTDEELSSKLNTLKQANPVVEHPSDWDETETRVLSFLQDIVVLKDKANFKKLLVNNAEVLSVLIRDKKAEDKNKKSLIEVMKTKMKGEEKNLLGGIIEDMDALILYVERNLGNKKISITNVKDIISGGGAELDSILNETKDKNDEHIDSAYNKIQEQINDATDCIFESIEQYEPLLSGWETTATEIAKRSLDRPLSIKEVNELKEQEKELKGQMHLLEEERKTATDERKAQIDVEYKKLEKQEAYTSPEGKYMKELAQMNEMGAYTIRDRSNTKADPLVKDMLKTALTGEKGQGKFIQLAMNNYFKESSKEDKRSMMKALIAQLKPNYKEVKKNSSVAQAIEAGRYLGGLLKGAGPVFQKLMQGLPEEMVMSEIREALSDVKSKLAPIDDEYVNNKLEELKNSTNGSVTEIKRVTSLGAASIGQAFLCKIYGPNLSPGGEEVVVKILRPDAKERIQRETTILKKCAKQVDEGMVKSFEGQLAKINEELNFNIERENIIKGAASYRNHSVDTNKEVDSVNIAPQFAAQEDAIVLTKAEGVTVDRYIENTKKEIEEVLKPFQQGKNLRLELNVNNVGQFAEKRAKLVQMIDDLNKRQQHLVKLSELWIRQAIYGNRFHHGDMHSGNILISDKKATVIDYGNATTLSEKERNNILTMTATVAAGEEFADDFIKAFVALLPKTQEEINTGKEVEVKKGEAFKHPRLLGKGEQFLNEIVNVMKMENPGDPEDLQTGEKIALILMRAQELGLELPGPIQNFSQCELRLQNTISEFNDCIYTLRTKLKELDKIEPDRDATADILLIAQTNIKNAMTMGGDESGENTLIKIKQGFEDVDEQAFMDEALLSDEEERKRFEGKFFSDIKHFEDTYEDFMGNKYDGFDPNRFLGEWKDLLNRIKQQKPVDPSEPEPQEYKQLKQQMNDRISTDMGPMAAKMGSDPLSMFGGAAEMITTIVGALEQNNFEPIEEIINILENEVPIAMQALKDLRTLRESQDSFFTWQSTREANARTLKDTFVKLNAIRYKRQESTYKLLKNLNADYDNSIAINEETLGTNVAYLYETEIDKTSVENAYNEYKTIEREIKVRQFGKDVEDYEKLNEERGVLFDKKAELKATDKELARLEEVSNQMDVLSHRLAGYKANMTEDEKYRLAKASRKIGIEYNKFSIRKKTKDSIKSMGPELQSWFEDPAYGKNLKVAYDEFRQIQQQEVELRMNNQPIPEQLRKLRKAKENEFINFYRKIGITKINKQLKGYEKKVDTRTEPLDFMTVIGNVVQSNKLVTASYISLDLAMRIREAQNRE